MWTTLLIKTLKIFPASQQRPLDCFLFALKRATCPQLFDACIQENRGHLRGCDLHRNGFLYKGSATQRDYFFGSGTELVEQFLKRCMLRFSECILARIAKDFGYLLFFPLFDSVVEIFKGPAQLSSYKLAYGGFSGAHETDQNYS